MTPDRITTPTADIENRMGIVPIESLLAERDEMVRQVAELRARHGPFGSWNDMRKIELSTIATRLRAEALSAGTKRTEAAIDDAAHSDPQYVEFVIFSTAEKARWAVLENSIQGINDTINRGQALARFLAAEVTLTRG